MYWLDKHARFRKHLSPYIDGRLSSAERTGLEDHLETCEACRAELEELRSTVAAVRGLPQANAPRSFALTPAMLERGRALPAPAAPPLALGMRMASAAVAVVLAVVIIGDLSDAGDGGSGARQAADELGAARSTEEFAAEADLGQADAEVAVPAPEVTSPAEGYQAAPQEEATASPGQNDTAFCPSVAIAATGATEAAGEGGSSGGEEGSGGAGGAGATAAASRTPQPAATATPQLRTDTGGECVDPMAAGALAPTTSATAAEGAGGAGDEGLSAQGGVEAEDDSGVSTLRVLEIVLAGGLLALLAGIAVELAIRRRRAA